MNKTKPNNAAVALAFVGMMFFAIGFALGINSFLVPVVENSIAGIEGKEYLILAATFLPFIFFGYPASATIRRIGYKRTMALSFAMFAVAFALFIPAANQGSFALFLLASFVSGTGNTFLQASVNPYATLLGPIESAAKRISIMGICNKLAWPIAPVFLAFVIGKSVHDTTVADLPAAFMMIIAVFVVLGAVSLLAPLPEVKAKGEDESEADDCPEANRKTSVWQFPHLVLGAITLFLYVGIETVALSTLVDYANYLELPNAQQYAWISSIGMVVGYICGIVFIPKYLSQARALLICSIVAIAGSLAVVLLPGHISIWAIGLLALGCSLMWPALWPLAMADLGKFTKAGSSLLTMAIAGGAVVPPVFGWLKSVVTMQQAYWIALPCFLFILYYGLAGYKIRK